MITIGGNSVSICITAMQGKGFFLGESDQAKITYLITNFSKSEPNLLKYSEALNLYLDRCVFNTKFTLTDFQPLFTAALLVQPNRPSDKIEVQGEKVITRQQFIFMLNETAKILYRPDPNYLQRFYQNFLSQKMQIQNGQINRARVMVVDELARKLIVEEVVKQLCLYSQQLKHIFIGYTIENYWSLKRKKRLLLTFREMVLQNKKWSYFSLILFLKESETTPHLMTVEHIEEFLRFIVPNINSKQQEFYSRHVLSDSYHKDIEGSDGNMHPGDPGIMLFEFQLLVMRLAYDSYPKDMEKKDLGMVLERYLKYLYLRKNEDLAEVQLPSINRKMINTMKEYYRVISNEVNYEGDNLKEEVENVNLFDKFAQKMNKELDNAPPLGTDFQELMKALDRELPKMPTVPVLEPEYTGKYDKNFAVTLGKQPPPEPVQKNDKPKAEKKDAGKKDQIPAREFPWENMPEIKLSTEDYMKKIDEKLNFQVKPLGDISRGTISKEGYPVLISEILFPPELPKVVVPFIQEANNALTDRNFLLALQNMNQGVNAWKKTSVEFQSVAELFFTYSKGNIYMAAGQIEYALNAFYSCRKLADTSKIPFNNPDRSLPFYGLGQVFYEMQEYEMAARSFLKAREIRQSVLGLEHVQTASVFNNLACCFFILGRSQEALGYIQIAEVVFDTELGPHHERTMTSRSNLKKITKGTFENKPQFRKFWEVFEEDQFQKKKKKKKDADGGKKGKK